MKKFDFTGKKFNRITVIKYEKTVKGSSYWLCLCDCGNEKIIIGRNLKKGHTKSCGCLRKEIHSLEPGLSAKHTKFSAYKINANRKNYPFELSFEDFISICEKPCFYCEKYDINKLNGIDRVNNNDGYTSTNSLPCCSICNNMKKAMEINDFLNHIKRIYLFNPLKNL